METRDKRFTLDLGPALQRRLMAIPSPNRASTRVCCKATPDRGLARDEANGLGKLLADWLKYEQLARIRQETFEDKTLIETPPAIFMECGNMPAHDRGY